MGGSQLTQLKSTLRQTGLSRTSQPKDDKKRKNQRKQLSSTSNEHRQAKLDDIGRQFNQFDVRHEKAKFDVVTRQGIKSGQEQTKGRTKATSQSRQAGIELVGATRNFRIS